MEIFVIQSVRTTHYESIILLCMGDREECVMDVRFHYN